MHEPTYQPVPPPSSLRITRLPMCRTLFTLATVNGREIVHPPVPEFGDEPNWIRPEAMHVRPSFLYRPVIVPPEPIVGEPPPAPNVGVYVVHAPSNVSI